MAVRILLLLWLGCLPALAQPTIVSATAATRGDRVRLVVITVVLENQGERTSPGQWLMVTCEPQVRDSEPGTMRGQNVIKASVQELLAGKDLTLTVQTPYTSRVRFQDQTLKFRAANVHPTQEVEVRFRAHLEPVER